MILVIDTNCLLVSIPKLSATRWLFDALKSGIFEFGISTEILEEYEAVIGGFYSPNLATNVVELLPNLDNAIWVTPFYRWNLISDQDDNKFVDCALACQADYIVTHDKHFNVLSSITFPKVNILTMQELKDILAIS
ncbi:putative toxin-antitoxin system toxin component, PIN family [Dyadobacter sp. CY107]|uniref:putative toxin-antitoxin system toxin component, PIN family n=1 Tax=Dyadobacter fanqingshengii TaxID=2906443 RepID=UPI001F301C72|nr:putative toxin-antitoxin system toxin component, PIN family [Dyadobacter fanqingshengii]MCF2505100.1 putative toxin-antitoxin system toxin component, PIN family [Dyadobacter fanqingshengii]